MLESLLAAKGVHYVATRFGPRTVRARAFDAKYQSGEWSGDGDQRGELPSTVARHLGGGDLLLLGCGEARVVEGLPPERLRRVLGVDLSATAIERARRRRVAGASFVVGDMETFVSPFAADVILLAESLYYIRGWHQLPMLRRYATGMKPTGVFVVTATQPWRFGAMLRRIRGEFEVLEDRAFEHSERRLLVFTSRRSRQAFTAAPP